MKLPVAVLAVALSVLQLNVLASEGSEMNLQRLRGMAMPQASETALPGSKRSRASTGPRGSGTRRLALALFDHVRLGAKDIVDTEIYGAAAVDAMAKSMLDATFMRSMARPSNRFRSAIRQCLHSRWHA